MSSYHSIDQSCQWCPYHRFGWIAILFARCRTKHRPDSALVGRSRAEPPLRSSLLLFVQAEGLKVGHPPTRHSNAHHVQYLTRPMTSWLDLTTFFDPSLPFQLFYRAYQTSLCCIFQEVRFISSFHLASLWSIWFTYSQREVCRAPTCKETIQKNSYLLRDCCTVDTSGT